MMNPLVSVILPVRNGARFVAEAIASVMAQSWRPLELLVIEGGSTDGTVELLASLAIPALRVIPQVGTGIPDAWNLGIREARGDVLAFLSADDCWTPDKLTRQVTALLADPALLYTIAHFRYAVLDGSTPPSSFNRDLLGRDLVGRIMETLVARRRAFEMIGHFDDSLRTAEDVDWYARASEQGAPHRVLPDVLLTKRVHEANTSGDATTNTPQLLRVLRRSIARRREPS